MLHGTQSCVQTLHKNNFWLKQSEEEHRPSLMKDYHRPMTAVCVVELCIAASHTHTCSLWGWDKVDGGVTAT
jgi:hypothetical protein